MLNSLNHTTEEQVISRAGLHLFSKVYGSLEGLTEQEFFNKHGHLVPPLPTDDGVLLRKALLSEDCMNELVKPLRDAGWSVEVHEPDDKALYMTVSASHGDKTFSVALLYSCATDNQTYKMLEKNCAAVLYRGAPYKQSSYTHGLMVHVGPVLGWQPPKAFFE
ncbi:hypothetical protein [Methylophilus sp.]|uniref:hypothetical protein n=1 Tax=Methylophilus sp. TaxID=29541 RepID=UPI0011D30CA9|nr:hypothetical protein [Methylophilus sp.]TXI46790.1 MAG: hypothetical protein E6Q52_02040 [Methylophilus sp.]